MTKLDPDKMPAAAHALIPLAERFGITDSGDRWHAVRVADPQTRKALTTLHHGIGSEFWEWLEGPESFSSDPTEEYLVMSALVMATEEATAMCAET
jgi:hypothetical protein